MQVAVAEVAEDNDPRPGQDLVDRHSSVARKIRNERERQRNVVLKIGAFAGLAFWDSFADAPESLTVGKRLRDDGIFNMAALDSQQQERFEALSRVLLALGVGRLE